MIPFPDPPLRGDGFVLRRWTDADSEAYRAAMRDPEATRRLNDYGDQSAADIDAGRTAGRFLVLTIADTESDVFLGFVALNMQAHETAELAYMVTPDARGRGLAQRAVRLLGDWAFAALPVGRLQLHIAPDNEASIRVAERCGYTLEGILRSAFVLRGTRQDCASYSRLPTDP